MTNQELKNHIDKINKESIIRLFEYQIFVQEKCIEITISNPKSSLDKDYGIVRAFEIESETIIDCLLEERGKLSECLKKLEKFLKALDNTKKIG